MTATLADLGTLDFSHDGLPVVQGSLDGGVAINSLDYTYGGKPLYGAEYTPSGPNDTTLAGEIPIEVVISGSLGTAIELAGTVEVEVDIDGYLNSGSSNKMEIVF